MQLVGYWVGLINKTMLKKMRLSKSQCNVVEQINKKLDYLCMREKERGHLTPSEKTRFKNLARYHKKIVFGV